MTTYTPTDPATRVVVVTGCGSGFGAEIVEALKKQGGYTIYATCRTQAACDKFIAMKDPYIRSPVVDICNDEHVDNLKAIIEAECPQGLYCLVNNAGMSGGGFFDFTSMDDFKKIMDVNYLGQVRVTKALLPSLRKYARARHINPKGKNEPRARIVAMTSTAARAYSPGLSGYHASKHAIAAFMDTLRVELAPWEIDIAQIEPYFAKTPIINRINNSLEDAWNEADSETKKMYGEGFNEGVKKKGEFLHKQSIPSKWVIDVTVRAIHTKNGAQKTKKLLVGWWWVPLLIKLTEIGPLSLTDWILHSAMRHTNTWPEDPFCLKDEKAI